MDNTATAPLSKKSMQEAITAMREAVLNPPKAELPLIIVPPEVYRLMNEEGRSFEEATLIWLFGAEGAERVLHY